MRCVKKFIPWIRAIIETLYYFCDKMWPFVLLAGSLWLLMGTLSNINLIKSLAIGILFIVACFLICGRAYKNKAMTLLGVVSLMLHFIISIIFNYVFKNFGVDSLEYHHMAAGITELLNSGVSYNSVPLVKQYFPNFISIIYFVFGLNRLMATFIVGFFSVIAGVVIYSACQMAKMDKFVGYLSSLAVWFMPGFLFFTSDLLKDSIVLLLTALSFYLFALVIYQKCSRIKKIALVIVLMITVGTNSAFRFYVFAPLVVGFGLGLMFYFFGKCEISTKLIIGIIVLGLISLFYVLANKYLTDYTNMDINELFERINAEREWAFAYASTGIKGYDISTLYKALKALPVLCFHYLMQPFPSYWLSGASAFYIKLLIPDMIAWYVMLPFVLWGSYIVVVKKNFIGISIIGYLVVFLCINALIVGNVGAIYRYRLQFQELAFVVAGNGIAQCFGIKVK